MALVGDSPLPSAVRISKADQIPTGKRGAVPQEMTDLSLNQDTMKESSAGSFAPMG